ncbi:hypothetical protein [Dactylosporangium maewongense]|uniref:hypothetical protein n=1 Tax=Dactylosporangium maewongense TaxID=634393 RepID=UPI0031D1A174
MVEHHEVVAGYGLGTRLPPAVEDDDLLALMGRDKKALGGFTFVLDGPDGAELVRGVAEPVLRDALRALRSGAA